MPSMLNILFWIIFGTLVGWIAALLQDKSRPIGSPLALAVTGAIGGLSGGLVGLMLNPTLVNRDAGADSLMFAIIGAIAFIVLALNASRHNHSS
jgi:uncharacterized membrane protein YeaQ/YmgE (transglycosylase-associated protein family)